MTAAPALSPIRNRPREVTTVAFYVSVTLAAELAVASSDDSKAILVGALWGTAVGLALAHWYAQTITAAIARGAFETNDAVEGLRELGAAVVVAFILSLPFVVFQTPTALVLSRWGVVIATSCIALALARAAGAGWGRAAIEAAVVFVIGVAVIETKAALSH
jgi:pimeloyl-ACP methyl ester carboxylesterase